MMNISLKGPLAPWAVATTAFFLTFMTLVLQGLQQGLTKAEDQVSRSLTAVVFLQPTLPDADAQRFREALRIRDPDIRETSYRSRDEALFDAQKDPAMAQSLVLIKTNPLPASYTVRWQDRAWLERDEPIDRIKGLPAVQDIRWSPVARSSFRMLRALRLWVLRLEILLGFLGAAWVFWGFFQFLSLHVGFDLLARSMAWGLAGGAVCLLIWSVFVRQLPPEVSLFVPRALHWGPLAVGAVAGIGMFGFRTHD